MTGKRRQLLQRHKQLEQAFGAADKVADESMQAALATMLLNLGHFLHELRNYQTAISTNLSYLEMTSDLDERAQEALQDAKQVQAAEQKLVYETIEALKQRSRPVLTTFPLREPLERAAAEAGNARVILGPCDTGFVLNGNPEHLTLVLHNLIRNATQAGASEIHLDVNLEPGGHAVRLLVHDDGPGISISRRDALFEPFGSSTKIEGTGLGLYLCRRYLGLFGGTVAVEEGPLGGAAFVIRLPGSVEKRESLMNDRSQSSPAA
jgi:signal transduction histidine kinase